MAESALFLSNKDDMLDGHVLTIVLWSEANANKYCIRGIATYHVCTLLIVRRGGASQPLLVMDVEVLHCRGRSPIRRATVESATYPAQVALALLKLSPSGVRQPLLPADWPWC